MTNEEFAKQFMQAVKDRLVPKIVHATVPFFALTKDDQIVRDRSAVLLQIGSDYLLVTAAHSLEARLKGGDVLCAGWDDKTGAPIPFHEATYYGTEEDSRDLAVVKLDPVAAGKLLKEFEPIRLNDISRRQLPPNSMFLVSGFPQAWMIVTERLDSAPLTYLARTFDSDAPPSVSFKYDPEIHILVEFKRDAVRDSDFEKVLLPSKEGIKGISGCGVWWLGEFSPKGLATWTPERSKLVGIEHTYWQQSGCVAATKIGLALDFIDSEFPSLRSALRIEYP